ncbi:MAG: hypothetical protein K2Y32_05295 [Candidatus Obscuribacterales bacterium]|uniref:Uncharacterized protein n=1 Tax=Candidatus Obscuribacter phosphatis TaxID=1906157 RepID=A0A8J7TN58_9BACT|nr:hypothetical protein [Candidatus Obscuribacter phosphatis]MBX9938644.1 hypothetical protein [Candidatus Obscuribacterales bacterium]OPZ91078.1 MAG: hypothetical protein BWY75_00464 [bacterium ADurb.Bin425]
MKNPKLKIALVIIAIIGTLAGAMMSFWSGWLVYSLPLKSMDGGAMTHLALGIALIVGAAVYMLKDGERSIPIVLTFIALALYLQLVFQGQVHKQYDLQMKLESAAPTAPATTKPAPVTPDAGKAQTPDKSGAKH